MLIGCEVNFARFNREPIQLHVVYSVGQKGLFIFDILRQCGQQVSLQIDSQFTEDSSWILTSNPGQVFSSNAVVSLRDKYNLIWNLLWFLQQFWIQLKPVVTRTERTESAVFLHKLGECFRKLRRPKTALQLHCKKCKHSVDRKCLTKCRYPGRWRTLYYRVIHKSLL